MFEQVFNSGNFIVAVIVIHEIFSVSFSLSVYLQSKNLDLRSAILMVESVIEQLSDIRQNSDTKFHDLFTEAQRLAIEINTEINVPRRGKYSTTNTIEDYYRQAVFIPFLDYYIQQLNERFLRHKSILTELQQIVPKFIITLSNEEISKVATNLIQQWPEDIKSINAVIFESELKLWQKKWEDVEDQKSVSFLESVNACNVHIFPNIYEILKIASTLPVSVATVERSFSTLKRIKNYLRNTTSENRLNGSATMSIHRECEIDTTEVIDIFSKKK